MLQRRRQRRKSGRKMLQMLKQPRCSRQRHSIRSPRAGGIKDTEARAAAKAKAEAERCIEEELETTDIGEALARLKVEEAASVAALEAAAGAELDNLLDTSDEEDDNDEEREKNEDDKEMEEEATEGDLGVSYVPENAVSTPHLRQSSREVAPPSAPPPPTAAVQEPMEPLLNHQVYYFLRHQTKKEKREKPSLRRKALLCRHLQWLPKTQCLRHLD